MNDDLEAWGAVLAGLAAAAGLGVRWMRGRTQPKPEPEEQPKPQDGGPRPVRPRRGDDGGDAQ